MRHHLCESFDVSCHVSVPPCDVVHLVRAVSGLGPADTPLRPHDPETNDANYMSRAESGAKAFGGLLGEVM